MIGLVLALFVAHAQAADPVVDALAEEIERARTDLILPNRPAPYYIAYTLGEFEGLGVVASLGGLVHDNEGPSRRLSVEVRVGSAEVDNSNFSARGEETGFTWTRPVTDAVPDAVRHDAWLVTDGAYKAAVENLARKQAARTESARLEYPPSFVAGEVVVARVEGTAVVDADAARDLARRLSAVFLEHPGVHASRVSLRAHVGRTVFLDSAGARVEQPVDEVVVRVIASARAADGRSIDDHATWVVPTMGDLPPIDAMLAEVESLASRLETWRSIPASTDAYVGPVLFEDAAAASLFRELLLPSLSGTPEPERARSRWGPETSQGREMARLKRRVLPPGWSVVDDPLADPTLPSSYPYDSEGQPATRVDLVQDGVVRGLLMSRTPNDQVEGSTGHARRFRDDVARAVPSNTTVEAEETLSRRKLVKRGLKLAVTYDLDHLLVVRRLADPSLGGSSTLFSFSFGATDDSVPEGLSAPVEVFRLYADGREESVAGMRFSGVDPRTLRDIVGAGPATSTTYLYPPYDEFGFQRDPMVGFPATLTAPAVLVAEMELVPSAGEAEPPPLLASPLEE